MGQLFPLPLPLQGVNRYHARSDQPASTCEDALNVFPFDRWGRSRIGQRPGTGQLWDDAIGSDTSFIQFIQQTAIGLSTDASVPDTALSETFTYADGSIDTVSGGAWITYTNPESSTSGVGSMLISGNKLVRAAASGGYTKLVADPVSGHTKYSVSMNVTTPATIANNDTIAVIVCRANGAPSSTNANVCLVMNRTSGVDKLKLQTQTNALITPSAGSASATVTFTASTTYALMITWDGDDYEVFLDGVSQFSGTTTQATGHTQVGIWISDNTDTAVDDFLVAVNHRAAVTRETDIVAVANGSVYMGNPGIQAALTTSGSSVLDVDSIPSGAVLFGKMYLTDGGNDLVVLDIATKTCSTWSSSAGTQTATTLGAYKIAVPWRGRLVLGHDVSSPQNFVASKVGDPTDFDLTGTGPDTAYAGNASTSGQISDPITALIPMSEDTLLIATDHQVHAMHGDISDGGTIDLISDQIGILSQTAWCKGSDGTIYCVGTTGFFAIPPGGTQILNLTDKTYNQFFKAINRKTMYVNLAWDRDRQGCFIFVTPVLSGTATHLYFDSRHGGFWPLQYPDSHGPVCCCVYDGDDPTDRYLLMGGRTGLVQIQSDTNRTDNGTAISCSVLMGPYQPLGPTTECIMTGLDLTTGEVFTGDDVSVWNMNWEVRGGRTAYQVTEGTPKTLAAGNLPVAGWQNTRVPRIRGSFIAVELRNGNSGDYFSIESATLTFVPGGKAR